MAYKASGRASNRERQAPREAHAQPGGPKAGNDTKEVAMLVTITSLLLLAAVALGVQGARPARAPVPIRIRNR